MDKKVSEMHQNAIVKIFLGRENIIIFVVARKKTTINPFIDFPPIHSLILISLLLGERILSS